MRNLVKIALLVVAIGMVGCAGGNDTTTKNTTTEAQQRPRRYVMTVNATPLNTAILAGAILVRGRTNLPEGSVISLSATQAFRFKHETDIRASSIAMTPATVNRRGRFTSVLTPLDYGDITVGLDHGAGALGVGPVALIDEAATVCAQFQTGEDFDGTPRQSDEAVVAAVGPNGEHLRSSPQRKKFGSLTPNPSWWLEVRRRVKGFAPGGASAIADVQGSKPVSSRLNGFCL